MSNQGLLPFEDAANAAANTAAADAPAQPRDRVATLAELADGFAHLLAERLHEHLGSDVSASVGCVESITYHDYLACLSRPTCVGVLRFDPPGAQGCVDLSPEAIFPMIDRLLGGRTHGPLAIPGRPLTEIERSFALQIIERAARALADSWGKAVPGLEVREEELDSDPEQSHLMPADEVVTVVRLLVRFSGCEGRLALCAPAPVIELLVGPELATEPLAEMAPPETQPAQDPPPITKNMVQQAVELRALLAETKVRLSDVIEMQAGDIITTDHPVEADVPIYMEGEEVFRGRLGQFRERRAIEITQGEGSAAREKAHANVRPAADGGADRS